MPRTKTPVVGFTLGGLYDGTAVWHSVSCVCRGCLAVDHFALDPGQHGWRSHNLVFLSDSPSHA